MSYSAINARSTQRRPGTIRAALLRRRGPAFTLLEILMVVAVMVVLAAMAAPRYARSLARYRADVAARRIAADLAFARERARATSRTVTVTFNEAAGTYTIDGMTDPDRPAGDYTVRLGDEPYRCTLGGVGFGGETRLVFNGFGVPRAGGSLKVAAGPWTRTVSVDGLTGQAVAP